MTSEVEMLEPRSRLFEGPAARRQPPPQAARAPRPAKLREIAAIVLLIALADVVLFRGHGYGGAAALFLAAPPLLWLGSPRRGTHPAVWLVGGMLGLLALRMIWLGSTLAAAVGGSLLAAFAMTLSGRRPHVLAGLAFVGGVCVAGFLGLSPYRQTVRNFRPRLPRDRLLSVGLPLLALSLFGAIFILANPHLATSFATQAGRLSQGLSDWITRFAPSWREVLFCFAAGWLTIGLLRPLARRKWLDRSPWAARNSSAGQAATLYPAWRNTLLAAIGLFAVYLTFEFATLWFRDFGPEFYYAGYAHRGAAWLTAALALATGVLSLIFRGATLADPRRSLLRRLAWIWSLENLVLAVAVYHRMAIYVGYNGMTRMRTVGLFGISTVVVGFLLVLWMVARQRSFTWLVRRQLWALAVSVYLFALTPVDFLAHSYNVRRILAGDLAPAVQISVHPLDAEGVLALRPLLESEHPVVRDGIRALFAQRELEVAAADLRQRQLGWTAYQHADRLLFARLQQLRGAWQDYADEANRDAAWERFDDYVRPWY